MLITGCAEAVASHPALLNVVQNTLALLKKLHPHTVILACAALPSSRDGQYVLAELDGLADVLHRVSKDSEYFEYSRLGTYLFNKRYLYAKGGVRESERAPESVHVLNPELIGPNGLMEEGFALLNVRLLDKFNSSKLMERFELLQKRVRQTQLVEL